MRFYTNPPPLSCGIDVQARSMDVCLVRQAGARLVHRTMHTAPAPCRKALAPYRAGLVVAVAWGCTWEGRAALCAPAARPGVLGQARSRNAMHGGKAHKDTRDSHTMAPRLRGGLLPQA